MLSIDVEELTASVCRALPAEPFAAVPLFVDQVRWIDADAGLDLLERLITNAHLSTWGFTDDTLDTWPSAVAALLAAVAEDPMRLQIRWAWLIASSSWLFAYSYVTHIATREHLPHVPLSDIGLKVGAVDPMRLTDDLVFWLLALGPVVFAVRVSQSPPRINGEDLVWEPRLVSDGAMRWILLVFLLVPALLTSEAFSGIVRMERPITFIGDVDIPQEIPCNHVDALSNIDLQLYEAARSRCADAANLADTWQEVETVEKRSNIRFCMLTTELFIGGRRGGYAIACDGEAAAHIEAVETRCKR